MNQGYPRNLESRCAVLARSVRSVPPGLRPKLLSPRRAPSLTLPSVKSWFFSSSVRKDLPRLRSARPPETPPPTTATCRSVAASQKSRRCAYRHHLLDFGAGTSTNAADRSFSSTQAFLCWSSGDAFDILFYRSNTAAANGSAAAWKLRVGIER